MTCSNNQTRASSQTGTTHPALRRLKRQRLAIGGVAVVLVGLALGWDSLAAAGLLPILFSTLPCLVMMGVCMKSMKSCSKKEQTTEPGDTQSTNTPALLSDSSSQRIGERNHA